jgi:hypothetical protein
MSVLNREAREVLQVMRERNTYREMLVELKEELMPKLVSIQGRLHGGSDAMRDEGHKLWVVINQLENLLGESK